MHQNLLLIGFLFMGYFIIRLFLFSKSKKRIRKSFRKRYEERKKNDR